MAHVIMRKKMQLDGACAANNTEKELLFWREGAEGGRRPIWNQNGAVRGEERLEESRGAGEGEEEGKRKGRKG